MALYKQFDDGVDEAADGAADGVALVFVFGHGFLVGGEESVVALALDDECGGGDDEQHGEDEDDDGLFFHGVQALKLKMVSGSILAPSGLVLEVEHGSGGDTSEAVREVAAVVDEFAAFAVDAAAIDLDFIQYLGLFFYFLLPFFLLFCL